MHASVVTVYYIQDMPATCFGHSYGHLQGGALQRIVIRIYRNIPEVTEPMAATCTMYAVCMTDILSYIFVHLSVPNCSVHGYGAFKVLRRVLQKQGVNAWIGLIWHWREFNGGL